MINLILGIICLVCTLSMDLYAEITKTKRLDFYYYLGWVISIINFVVAAIILSIPKS